jgi:hypothetical protein
MSDEETAEAAEDVAKQKAAMGKASAGKASAIEDSEPLRSSAAASSR